MERKIIIMVKDGRLNITKVWERVHLKNLKNISHKKRKYFSNIMVHQAMMLLIKYLIKPELMIEKNGLEIMIKDATLNPNT